MGVHFLRGLEQKIRQRRMQVGTGDELHRWCDQCDRMIGQVLTQVEGTHGQINPTEESQAAHVGIGLDEIELAHRGRVQQATNRVGLGRVTREEHGIDTMFQHRL